MKKSLIVIICVVIVAISGHAQNSRRDGNWWISQDRRERIAFIDGFTTGMELGFHFSYWKFDRKPDDKGCSNKVHGSYNEHLKQYLANVTVRQLVDGLDEFYSDYKNRRIDLVGATWLVVNGIAGTPKERLDKMIEEWRKHPIKE